MFHRPLAPFCYGRFVATPRFFSNAPKITNAVVERIIDCDNSQQVYSSLTTWPLLRSIVVLRICASQKFVANATALLSFSEKISKTLTRLAIKKTFFAHFCAGESADDARPTVERLAKANIHVILTYAAESDIGTASVCSYDQNCVKTIEAIEAAAALGDRELSAFKLTALTNPELLEGVSTQLLRSKALWSDFFGDENVNLARFQAFLASLSVKLRPNQDRELFERIDVNSDGVVQQMHWEVRNGLMQLLTTPTTQIFVDSHVIEQEFYSQELEQKGVLPHLTDVERLYSKELIERLDKICERTKQLNVGSLIDAEQSYLQPAIDCFAFYLQRKFNANSVAVYNTYQAYLKSTKTRLTRDLAKARLLQCNYGVKLVRGAYIATEQARATQNKESCPVHDSLQNTHDSYNGCVELLLHEIKARNGGLQVILGTHNRESIEQCVKLMQDLGMTRTQSGVRFGQLLGMADFLTFPLGQAGFDVYKCMPYGPLEDIIPYLVRRAVENSSVLSNSHVERRLMTEELKRRLKMK